jgi:cytidyltransferase-like protein
MAKKEIVVCASGYFDPIHRGHIEYLELAKRLGDRLIVILNNENQAKQKKGFMFMPIEDKIAILKSIRFVDEVILSIDDDLTQCKTLAMIKPDIFAKGGDRYATEIPEAGICNELGIKIIDGLGAKVQSSSKLIRDVKDGSQ